MDEDNNNFSIFDTKKPTNTYGMQRELKKFAMREYLNKEVQYLDEVGPDDEILDDDLINSNPVTSLAGADTVENIDDIEEIDDYSDLETKKSKNTRIKIGKSGKTVKTKDIPYRDKLEKSRYIKEIRGAINIDSRYRSLFEEKELPKNPNTESYTRKVIDPETEEIIIERYTADDLNLEWEPDEDNPILCPFIEKNGKIYFREPRDFSPSMYQIQLPNPLNNVKSMELISSEIPNPFPTINSNNNKIFIDIKSKDSNHGIPLKENDRGLPFFLIHLPIGNYDFEDLLEMIEETVNENIRHRTRDSLSSMFTIDGDKTTGIVSIKINYKKEYKFHWRFWFCPKEDLPEDNFLYYMLGFAKPYERDSDGCSVYVTKWTNLFIYKNKNPKRKEEIDCCYIGIKKEKWGKPYRPINLVPNNYIYLILEGQGNENTQRFGTMLDLRQPGNKLFAKIVFRNLEFGQIAYNTFVSTINFFPDVPLRRLDKLRIKWVDVFGNLVDFQGLEHSFTLAYNQYLDQLTASSFSSVRGVTDPTSFTSKERIFSFNYIDPNVPNKLFF